MKPKYVHTKAQIQRQRNPGDDPDLGRVTRMEGGSKRLKIRKRVRGELGKPSSRRHDRRRIRQMRARKFAFTLWLSIILVGCFIALFVGMMLWLSSQGDRKDIAPLFVRDDSLPALHLTDFPPPNEREAMEIIRSAIAARDEETLRTFVHDSHEADTADVLRFFADTGERDGKLIQHQWIGSSDTAQLQIQTMILAFSNDGRITNRLAMLVPNESGIWRLDFPAYARWCNPPIQLMNEPSGYPGGRVRVFLGRDTYFNGPFSSDREWACFAITSPDTETSGFAYCRVHSPEHQALETMLAQTARQIRATLEIARVENAESRQFRITSVVSQDWVAVNPPTGK
jgi:hypothetical protein